MKSRIRHAIETQVLELAAALAAAIVKARIDELATVVDATKQRSGTPRFGAPRYSRDRKHCEFYVDGFYRMQPVGPGRKKRKRVWVRPYTGGNPELPPSLPTRLRRAKS